MSDRQFRSDPTMVFIVKFWFPFLLLTGEIAVLSGADHLIEIALLPTLLALFYLSVAQVRPGEKVLRFRYFYLLSWKELSYEEIQDCRVSFAPGLGVLKLRRFVPPWGKVYFVLEGPKLEVAWPGGQSSLTRLINAYREPRPVPAQGPAYESTARAHHYSKNSLISCGPAFLAGVAYFFTVNKWFSHLIRRVDPQQFPVMASVQRFQEMLFHWPWNLAAAAALLAIIFSLRSNKAWPFAFVLGGLVGRIAARGFR